MAASADNDDYRAIPEVFRARAQGSAGLATTGAAAVAAGAVFGGATNLNLTGQIAAVVAVALLLVSVIGYVLAANYTFPGDIPKSNNRDEIGQVVRQIKCRTNAASIAGLLAVAAFVVVVWSTVAWSTARTEVQVVLTESGMESLQPLCSRLSSSVLNARIASSGSPLENELVPVTVDDERCGESRTEVFLPRSAIVAVLED